MGWFGKLWNGVKHGLSGVGKKFGKAVNSVGQTAKHAAHSVGKLASSFGKKVANAASSAVKEGSKLISEGVSKVEDLAGKGLNFVEGIFKSPFLYIALLGGGALMVIVAYLYLTYKPSVASPLLSGIV